MMPAHTPTFIVIGASKVLVVQTLLAIRAYTRAKCVVVCTKGTRFLRYSPLCAEYGEIDFDGEDDDAFVETANRIAASTPDAVVVPGDCDGIRVITRIRHRLESRIAPLPDIATLDCFDDKWRFHEFCKVHGLSAPASRLLPSKHDLDFSAAAEELGVPFLVKPLDQTCSRGVRFISNPREYERAILANGRYTYAPLVIQRCIEGVDVGVDVLSFDGRVAALAVQRRMNPRHDGSRIEFFHSESLEAAAHRLCAASRFTGVMNIDVRIEHATGRPFLLEANPRVWRSLSASVWCGLNFIELSLDPARAAASPRMLTSGSADTYYHPVFRPALWRYALDRGPRGRMVRAMTSDACILATSGKALFDRARQICAVRRPGDERTASVAGLRTMGVR